MNANPYKYIQIYPNDICKKAKKNTKKLNLENSRQQIRHKVAILKSNSCEIQQITQNDETYNSTKSTQITSNRKKN